jgi:hypothetical protein
VVAVRLRPSFSEDIMIPKTRLPDCPTFRQLWMERVSRTDIAGRFGVSLTDVTGLAKAYGYPERSSVRMVPQGPMPSRAPVADPKRLAEAAAPKKRDLPDFKAEALATDRWSPDRIVAVFRTGGRYAELTALAQSWGVPLTALVGLWHRVRVAG